MLTFISEPTTSDTYCEDDFHRPYVTICRYYPIRSYEINITNYPTLLNVFKYGSYSLPDMLQHHNYHKFKKDPNRESHYTSSYGNWTEKINYARGGLCSTLDTTKNRALLTMKYIESTAITSFDNDTYYFQKWTPDYVLYVHKLDDFWGGLDQYFTTSSDSEMSTIWVSTGQKLVINSERDIMPNLRRQPCEEDPNYSRSTCWRDCFLDTLNCTLLEGDNTNGKPICTPADYDWFSRGSLAVADDPPDEPAYRCSCRRACARERYSISFQPTVDGSYEWLQYELSFSGVRRTTRTYVTYDIIDLMADIGGFIGLLLGYSLYSVFDDLKALVTRLFVRRAASAPVDAAPADPAGELGSNVWTFSIKIDPAQEDGKPRNRNING